jgi:hypothetical protein
MERGVSVAWGLPFSDERGLVESEIGDLLGLRLRNAGIPAQKVFVDRITSEHRSLSPPPFNGRVPGWVAHVAILWGTGKGERVLDAAIADRPLVRAEWYEMIGFDSTQHAVEIHDLRVFNPDSNSDPKDNGLSVTRRSLAYTWDDVDVGSREMVAGLPVQCELAIDAGTMIRRPLRRLRAYRSGS